MNRNLGMGLLGLLALALLIAVAMQVKQNASLRQELAHARTASAELDVRRLDAEEKLRLELAKQKTVAAEGSDNLAQANRALQTELDTLRRSLADEKAARVKEVAALKASEPKPAEVDTALAAITDDASTDPEAETQADDAATTKSDDSPMKAMAQMMKNPAMKKMMRTQQQSVIDMMYDSLYDSLDLPEEDMAKLKELLLDKQMVQVEMGLEMMDGEMSPEKQKDLMDRIKAATDEADKAVEALLDEDDYKWYKAYEDTKNERMQIGMFNQSLDEANQLTSEQQDELTLAMFDARSSYKSLNDMQDPSKMDLDTFTPDRMNGLLADLKAVNQQYIEKAATIMNEEQLKRFKSHLEQQQAMQEMGLKMASQMFGKKSKPAAPAAEAQPTPAIP